MINYEIVRYYRSSKVPGRKYDIYNPKSKWWRKHSNAGNDHLTVSNYPDVSKEELVDAMKGVFPK